MKKIIFILTILVSTFWVAVAQDKKSYEIDFTNPKSVVNAIFYAAQTKDFAIMQCLCDPYGRGDGDTKRLCAIPKIVKLMEDSDGAGQTKEKIDEFVTAFKVGRINGEVSYKEYKETLYAKVPFWFNHPSGASRSDETMNLVKRYGNWYLSSF